ncbi:MAG: DUF177 domain-containing protein [Blastochloris sp.]|jgi:uncharacterized protein|nr:DUF177 domain-containing protein [Blastochloris sp.]
MKILITDLRDEQGIDLKGTLDPAGYELSCGQGDQWTAIDYLLRADRMGNECLVTGSLTAKLQVACSRCLEPLPYQIQIPDFQHTLEITNEESIDLTPLIREDILLNFPIAASCQLAVGNKCPYTGVVYKEDDHGFADKRRDDVWAALEKLKEN